MESKKTVRLHHITLMRVFAIVGVVMFHTYQMTWANHLPEPMRSVMYDMYFTPINCWLINISMPMFVAVSGYLFFWQLERGKIGSWGVLLRKKSLRLLAPYFVFAIAMMFTTNNYHNWMLLISGNYSHLWFLPALFWWFFVAYALRWVLCRWWGWCGFFAIFAVVSYMCGRFLPLIMGMNFLTTVWFFFFLIGGGIKLYKSEIYKVVSWRGLHWAMLFAGLVLLLLTAESYGDGGLSMFLSQMLILLSVFSILESFDLSWVERVPAIGFIDRCSFGIFIFHYWLGPYMISTTAKRIFPIEAMFAAHPYISPFCFFLATMAASIVATLLLLRTRVGRFLIG